jgi:hypothetical protein
MHIRLFNEHAQPKLSNCLAGVNGMAGADDTERSAVAITACNAFRIPNGRVAEWSHAPGVKTSRPVQESLHFPAITTMKLHGLTAMRLSALVLLPAQSHGISDNDTPKYRTRWAVQVSRFLAKALTQPAFQSAKLRILHGEPGFLGC